jgi:CHAT domain-containing protein/tetratricopeptide (TPR) repeat protein
MGDQPGGNHRRTRIDDIPQFWLIVGLLLSFTAGCKGAGASKGSALNQGPCAGSGSCAGDPAALVAQAASELDGSFSPLDMRGVPLRAAASAARAEERARTLGRGDLLAQAQILHAAAAASGGDYGQAAAIGRDVLARTPAADRPALQLAIGTWSRLRLSMGQASFMYTSEFRYLFPEEMNSIRGEPDYESSLPAVVPVHSLYGLSLHVVAEATLAGAAMGRERLLNIARGFAQNDERTACGSTPCAWGSLLAARLFAATQDRASSQQELQRASALATAAGDRGMLAVLALAKADLLAAPNGDVFDLNLDSQRMARTTLEMNSGVFPTAFESVPATDLKEAEAAYADARTQFDAARMPRGGIHCDARRAYLLFVRGQYAAAADAFAHAERSFRESGDLLGARRSAMARVAALLASEAFATANDAAASLREELVTGDALGLVRGDVLMMRSLARWLMVVRRNPQAALEALTYGRELAERAGLPYAAHEVWAELADLYASLGERSDAIRASRAARDALDDYEAHLQDEQERGMANAARGELLLGMIRDLLAMRDFKSAKAANEEVKALVPSITVPVARLEIEKSLRQYDFSLAIEGAAMPPAGMDARSQAIMMLKLGHNDEAFEKLKGIEPEVVDQLGKLSSDSSLLQVQRAKYDLEILVQLYMLAHRYERAKKIWDECEQRRPLWLFEDASQPWQRPQFEAELLAATGNTVVAEKLFRTSIETAERSASKLTNLRDQAGFLDETTAPYRGYANLLARHGREGEALSVLEQARARVFRTQLELASSFLASAPGGPKGAVLTEWRARVADLAAVRAGRARASLGQDDTQIKELDLEESRLQAEVERLDGELDASIRARLAPMDGKALVASVAKALDPSVTSSAVVYALLDSEVWAWVIDQTGLRGFKNLGVTKVQIRSLVASFQNDVKMPNSADLSARRLYDALLAPIAPMLPRPDPKANVRPRIVVVAAGPLLAVPFHALRSAAGPILEDYDFSYAPSLRAYVAAVAASEKYERVYRVSAFGGSEPPGASKEASALADFGPTFVGDKATSAAFEEAVSHPGIVHAATHGELDPINPFLSNIRFADDDRLEGRKILRLDTRSWLVTLTACYSGVSAASASDEVSSVGGAFLATGVPTVVMGQWEVGDERAYKLTKMFYARLQQRVSPVVALCDAERALEREGDFPKYWAPLIVMGSDR